MSYRFWTWNPSYMLSKRLSVMVSFNPLDPPLLLRRIFDLGGGQEVGGHPKTLGRESSLHPLVGAIPMGLPPSPANRSGWSQAKPAVVIPTPGFNPLA